MPAPNFGAGAYFPGITLVGRFDHILTEFNENNGNYTCDRPVGPPISCTATAGLSASGGPTDLMALVINGGTDTLSEISADLVVLFWVLNSSLSVGRFGCAVTPDVLHAVICGPQVDAEVNGTASADSFTEVTGNAIVIIGGESHALSKHEWAERASTAMAPTLHPAMTASGAPTSWQDFARCAVRIEDVNSASFVIAGDGHAMGGDAQLSLFAYEYTDNSVEPGDNFYMVT